MAKVVARKEVKRGLNNQYGLVSKRQTLTAACTAASKLPQIRRGHATSAFVSCFTLLLIGQRVDSMPHNARLLKLLRTANLPA
jgi:hypothetical protein